MSLAVITLAAMIAASPAVERVSPRTYDVVIQASVIGNPTLAGGNPYFVAGRAELHTPLIMEGAFSVIDPESISVDAGIVPTVAGAVRGARRVPGSIRSTLVPVRAVSHDTELRRDQLFGTSDGIVRIGAVVTENITWTTRYRAATWSSRVDEARLREATWPRTWPEDVRAALEPDAIINAADPIFAAAVQKATGGRLRLVRPYAVAKMIVRHCVQEMNYVEPPLSVDRQWDDERLPVPHADAFVRRLGWAFPDAEWWPVATVAARGEVRPAELTRVCIATLRAAGIPARPVAGLWDHPDGEVFPAVWGEFYLPEHGWIPFDPNEMKRVQGAYRRLDVAWRGFGDLPELNRRIPLSYQFELVDQDDGADAALRSWGYSPGFGVRVESTRPPLLITLNVQLTSRGVTVGN